MDLANTHMVNITLDFLQQQIKFIPQRANPPYIASLKLTKDFWAALKKVSKTTSLPTLKQRIHQITRKVPLPMVLCLFNTIK